jgi:GNAT superfamily N-acetyltransferase
MNDEQATIRRIKLKDLAEFARSTIGDPAYARMAPISFLRAKSQSKNPMGDPEDIALVAAYYKQHCVGYLGLMPGLLNHRGRVSRITFMTTFFLDAEHRGKGFGKRLLVEIQQLGVDLVATGITRNVEGLYRSVGFRHPVELAFYRLHPGNTPYLKKAADDLRSREKNFFSKPVGQLSEKTIMPAVREDEIAYFQRDITAINWMLENPWVVSRQDARKDVEKYFFSRVRDLFQFTALEIFTPDRKTCLGYVVMSVSRNKNSTTVKVLDYYFHHENDIAIAGYLGVKWSVEHGAERLEYPGGLAAFFESHPDLAPLIKRKKRLYLFHPSSDSSPLSTLAGRIEPRYSDSDTAFT